MCVNRVRVKSAWKTPLHRGYPRLRAGPGNLRHVDARATLTRRQYTAEVALVLALSLGASAVYAVVDLLATLTAKGGLANATATLNQSQAPGRPWLDLTYQLLGIASGLVPVLLAIHLLQRDHDDVTGLLGINLRRPGSDLGTGVGLAALIGIPGLGLYWVGRQLGIGAQVVPAALPHVWWAIGVLVLSAIENAISEEVIVVGYLTTRLSEFGWSTVAVIATSAVLRGSYHLYQGFGAFVGNAVMGVIFAYFYLRFRRVLPLIVAHSILDVVSFVGYDLVGKHLSFLH
jgi:membrane protease YdiL (CAAX protease family)